MRTELKRRCTTITIALSIVLLMASAFLYAGPYLSPKTFEGKPAEKTDRYNIVTQCLFWTGLFGMVDGIWRRHRIDRHKKETANDAAKPEYRPKNHK